MQFCNKYLVLFSAKIAVADRVKRKQSFFLTTLSNWFDDDDS